jgi:hypothetical protein
VNPIINFRCFIIIEDYIEMKEFFSYGEQGKREIEGRFERDK